jgi:hypothetical protein
MPIPVKTTCTPLPNTEFKRKLNFRFITINKPVKESNTKVSTSGSKEKYFPKITPAANATANRKKGIFCTDFVKFSRVSGCVNQ